VVTSGCMEAVVMCLRAVTKPGDTVAVESPAYFGIYQVIENLGLKLVEISSDPTTGPDLDCLQSVIKEVPVKACLFVPNFNNPSGSCMPDENKKKLVEIITQHNIPLIEDDIYGELYFGRHRPKTCKYYDTKGLVLHCSSLSKSLAPGYRIGWILPGKFLEPIIALKMMHTISSVTLTQAAMAHFLSIGRYEYHLKNLRKALHTQCLRYIQGVMQYFPEDTRISRPQGGFVLWVELNKKVDTYNLSTEALKHQISVAPGRIFSNSCNYSNYLRIGYGSPWNDKVEKGLKTLGNLVKKMV
jgi:DNA-binding transcriptional MocR family regulator